MRWTGGNTTWILERGNDPVGEAGGMHDDDDDTITNRDLPPSTMLNDTIIGLGSTISIDKLVLRSGHRVRKLRSGHFSQTGSWKGGLSGLAPCLRRMERPMSDLYSPTAFDGSRARDLPSNERWLHPPR